MARPRARIRFRGRSGGDPLSLLRGLIGPSGYLWLDDGTGEFVDAQAVSVWTDVVQGKGATQGTADDRLVGSFNVSTGRVEVVGDGVSDDLDLSGMASVAGACSAFALVNMDQTAHTTLIGTNTANSILRVSSAGQMLFEANNVNTSVTNTGVVADTTLQMLSMFRGVVGAGALTAWVDGVDVTSASPTNTETMLAPVHLMSRETEYLNGSLMALAWHPSEDLSAKRAQIEALINAWYGDPVTLP